MSTSKTSIPVKHMVFTALFTAVLCVVAPFSITVGPIPLSFATLVIYLAAGTINWKYATVSILLYVILGAIGLPVFSNFGSGFHKVVGPTGGFIVGYIPLAPAIGLVIAIFNYKRWAYILGMVIGTVILYTCGVAWFIFQASVSLITALMACVVPFLIGDSIKIIVASILAPQLRAALPGNAEFGIRNSESGRHDKHE